MTATDRLRELLDERGVEYETEDRSTIRYTEWGDWLFAEPLDAKPHTLGAQCELMRIPATPEQAIDATLGSGTCHDKGNIERFICSECGCRLDLQDDDWEATMWLDDGVPMVPRFCPNCGAKVVDE